MYASPLKEQVFNDNLDVADSMLEQALQEWKAPKGEVYLVGAGPGDPELITLKALRLMQQADVVIYDRLVSAPILELCRRDATKYMLVKRVLTIVFLKKVLMHYWLTTRKGKRVCRLKGETLLFLAVVAKRSKSYSKLASHFKLFPVLLLRQVVQLMQVFRLPIVIMPRVSAFLQAI